MKKQMAATYGVIGLGRFGTALAMTLAKAGKEVIVIDKIESKWCTQSRIWPCDWASS